MPFDNQEKEISNNEHLLSLEMANKEVIRTDIEYLSESDKIVLMILSFSDRARTTRLQKLSLLINALKEGTVPSSHDAYFFGGFSEDIEDSIAKLSEKSILNFSNAGYFLSPYGKRIISEIKATNTQMEKCTEEATETIVSALSELSDSDVLDLTYYLFPELAKDSIIKSKVEKRIRDRGIKGVRAYKFKKEQLDEFIRKIQKDQ